MTRQATMLPSYATSNSHCFLLTHPAYPLSISTSNSELRHHQRDTDHCHLEGTAEVIVKVIVIVLLFTTAFCWLFIFHPLLCTISSTFLPLSSPSSYSRAPCHSSLSNFSPSTQGTHLKFSTHVAILCRNTIVTLDCPAIHRILAFNLPLS